MPRKRDGFVPLSTVAEAVELSGDRTLTHRAAASSARRHFTRLDQVTQLVAATLSGSATRGITDEISREGHHSMVTIACRFGAEEVLKNACRTCGADIADLGYNRRWTDCRYLMGGLSNGRQRPRVGSTELTPRTGIIDPVAV